METIIVHWIGAASTEEVWCGMHTLIGESNQWWNLSTPDASVETGITKAFQQPPHRSCRKEGKMDLPG